MFAIILLAETRMPIDVAGKLHAVLVHVYRISIEYLMHMHVGYGMYVSVTPLFKMV